MGSKYNSRVSTNIKMKWKLSNNSSLWSTDHVREKFFAFLDRDLGVKRLE
jgi:hypothetical protein